MSQGPFLYTGELTNEIAFPPEGLGAGSIRLAGNVTPGQALPVRLG